MRQICQRSWTERIGRFIQFSLSVWMFFFFRQQPPGETAKSADERFLLYIIIDFRHDFEPSKQVASAAVHAHHKRYLSVVFPRALSIWVKHTHTHNILCIWNIHVDTRTARCTRMFLSSEKNLKNHTRNAERFSGTLLLVNGEFTKLTRHKHRVVRTHGHHRHVGVNGGGAFKIIRTSG